MSAVDVDGCHFRMKTAGYGRMVFGAAAVLFGVIALMWPDAATWQTLLAIRRLPGGAILGGCLMAAQIAGGVGLPCPLAARPASVILSAVYLLFSLACLPGIFAAPAVYAHTGSFFEQFCLLCGAAAVYAATDTNAARAGTLAKAARVGLGVCAVSFTVSQIVYLRVTAELVPAWIPPNAMFWAIGTTAAFGLAAIAILSNRAARVAIRWMSLMVALFGVLVWAPRLMAHPEAHGNWSELALTLLIAGAAWMVGAGEATGRTAWTQAW